MNLYLVSREDDIEYDETTSYVVAAPDELEARNWGAYASGDQSAAVWHTPTTTVTLIGTAAPDVPAGGVHYSYNAG
jgi:hypothetical protein